MIIKTQITLNLHGENFSPCRLSELSDVTFNDVIEKGVTQMATGRFKGQTTPYGSASLIATARVSEENDYNKVLYELLDNYHKKVNDHAAESGVEEMVLWLSFSFDGEGQVGFELHPDSLFLIGEMGIVAAINMDVDNKNEAHSSR